MQFHRMGKSVLISGVIITFNEEKNIGRCIVSLKELCDEIIVVDSYSTDRTKEICLEHDVRFIENTFAGHIEQKNFAMKQASSDIVLSLDADEAVSDQLRQSIEVIKSNWTGPAYRFNRFTNFCGQWIKHSGWYPDTKTRLWDRRIGKWGGTNPHDSVELGGNKKAIKIKGDLLHYSYYTREEHTMRSAKYAKIAAKAMFEQGRRASLFKMWFSSAFRFVQDYFLRLGILDGFYGYVICRVSSRTTFQKYAHLRALHSGKDIDQ